MIIAKYLSDIWTTVAPAVGNHLWQSTLFAVVAGLLTLMLRKNHARARYWLWLAASLKFLIPFSLLVGIGGQLGWLRATDGIETGFTFAMDEFSQPFSQVTAPVVSHAARTDFHFRESAPIPSDNYGGGVVVRICWRRSCLVRAMAKDVGGDAECCAAA